MTFSSKFMNVMPYDLMELWIFRLGYNQMVNLGISMRWLITNLCLAIWINTVGLLWLEATTSGFCWGQRLSWRLRELIHGQRAPSLLVARAHKTYYVTKHVQTQDNMLTMPMTSYIPIISISGYIMWPFSRGKELGNNNWKAKGCK